MTGIAANFEVSPQLSPKCLRTQILNMAFAGNAVHVACAFSLVEIVSVLYSGLMNFDRARPDDPNRDYLILSKGHGVMALYAAYKQLGWLDQNCLDSYFSDGSLLHGLCEFKIPGMEVSSGSLGHGLPIATGMAYGLKMQGRDQKVYCIVGDGEMNEGPMWESLLFASHHRLENLCVIVDANGFQAMGPVAQVLNMEPFVDKFRAFGFDASECDGHNMDALVAQLNRKSDGPRALVARTIKGKGVDFMENKNEWHYSRLTQELLDKALHQVNGK